MIDGAPTLTALLGPTNTGKTHRAVERMLEHRTGMLGLPLRLLAREVYDRITAALGESSVALVTGEEKRIPRRPAYWVCTVEAMPVDRDVDFLAIDEIQLAAHPERGHVFTDRILNARGRKETWLLGADTMRRMLESLVPTASIVGHPRLSTLTSAGRSTLASLPPRSAVIAFSMPRVYELAERIRRARGGAAVVLGALSPRARNAQVAMYQAGEVSAMVATDAIGMGLNLDIDHVAFADLRKFDGREGRALESDEIAQIAGRAGRYTRSGTFGTLAPLPELAEPVARDVEAHRFAAVRQVVWRNSVLDFESVDALVATLRQAPPGARLQRVEHADDHSALVALRHAPEVRRRADVVSRVKLLWEVCQIPDYRKLWLEDHPRLVKDLFLQLTGASERVEGDWLAGQLEGLGDVDGDLDALLRRLAFVRTWSYVAQRDDWVADGEHWRAVTRDIEDRVSDALHERLVARFVDRVRTTAAVTRARAAPDPERGPGPSGRGRRSPPAAPGAAVSHPFEKLRTIAIARANAAPPVRHDAWVDALVEARHDAFHLDAGGLVSWSERVVGRVVRGPDLLRPEVKLADLDGTPAGARARIHRRLSAWMRDWVAECLSPLRGETSAELSAPARGIVYQLEQRLGTITAASAREQVRELDRRDRDLLARLGVQVGSCVLFVPRLLKPAQVARRATLCAVYAQLKRTPRADGGSRRGVGVRWPDGGAVSVPRHASLDPELYLAMGYPVFGKRAIRADIAERLYARVASAEPDVAERAPEPHDETALATLLGCPASEVAAIVEALSAAAIPSSAL